jgi:hypothetical protein
MSLITTFRWPSIGYSPLRTAALLTLMLAAYATRYPPLMGVYIAVIYCVVLANLKVFTTAGVRERAGASIFVLVLTIMLPLSVFRGETAILHYAGTLASLAAAFLLTQSVEVYFKACRLILIASQTAVLVYLFRTGLANFPLENILPNSSSNGITSYLVVMQASYSLVSYLLYRRTALPTALVTLFICFVGFGRGSLLAAGALIAMAVIFRVPGRSVLGTLVRTLALVGVLVGALSTYSAAFSDLIAGTKIGGGLYDPSRMDMMRDYMERIDAGTVWSGAGYEGTRIADRYNNNPHNSLIRAHHIFGLPYLLLILCFPLYMARGMPSRPVKLYAAGIFFIVVFRSFTEPILFPTLFDFFYFASCLVLAKGTQPAASRTEQAAQLPVAT